MAGISKAEREKRAAEAAALAATSEAAEPASDGLIAMAKAGETLRIHPTCVRAHQAAGWSIV